MLRRVECTVPAALAVERQSQTHHSKSYAIFFLQILSFIILAINTLKLLKRSEIIMFCHFSVCSFLKDVLVTGGEGGMSETQKVHAVLGCISDRTAKKQLILPVLTSYFSDRVFDCCNSILTRTV